jgi:hypothetical protein
MSRRRAIVKAVAVGLTVVAAAAIGWSTKGDAGSSGPPPPVPTGTAPVVRTDLTTTQQVNGTLGYPAGTDVVSQTTGTAFTALPAPGTVIDRGQTVFEVDGRVVPLVLGARPAWRTLGPGVTDGPDVRQLEENLVALGHADPVHLTVDDHFTAATAASVRHWQQTLGWRQTGTVRVGDVVWAPGPIRVAGVPVTVGMPAAAGTIVLHTTGLDRVVTVTLPVTSEHLVRPDDAVTVHLPDGTTTPATVASVSGSAASPPSDGNTASQPRAVDATVEVTASLTQPEAAGQLDQTPVAIDITEASVTGVLAVPINALVAPADGGLAVEVVDGADHRLVAVHTGLFARTMVEISGAGITAGTMVVVPAP